MLINELSGEQRRQLIDAQHVFGAWRETSHAFKRRFAGSMRWGERNGAEYLLRKVGRTELLWGDEASAPNVPTKLSLRAVVKIKIASKGSPSAWTNSRPSIAQWVSAGCR